MRLSELSQDTLALRLSQQGLVLRTGPFNFRIHSEIPHLVEPVSRLYAHYPVFASDTFCHYTVRLAHGAGIRRWLGQQVRFEYQGEFPFEPLPISHSYPQLEWAMNWCISTQAHQYLILHAATIERDGHAMILPAPSGSGKSTLCAALIHRGWRLLSDELALISVTDRSLAPLVRPVSLKNKSIDILQTYEPSAVFSNVTHDTIKGTVAHMQVPDAQVDRMAQHAMPAWIVFPRYVADSAPRLEPFSKAQTLVELARNSFNYALHGRTGFSVLSKLLDDCNTYTFEYSQLDDAVATFSALAVPPRQGAV